MSGKAAVHELVEKIIELSDTLLDIADVTDLIRDVCCEIARAVLGSDGDGLLAYPAPLAKALEKVDSDLAEEEVRKLAGAYSALTQFRPDKVIAALARTYLKKEVRR